jgi:hypothetical protein
MSKLDAAIAFCGLYEAELLVALMLRYWEHPSAADDELKDFLVESAAEVLTRSKAGERFFENINPDDMNFVAAVWYAESCHVSDSTESDVEQRRDWLTKVRRALPACFCDPSDLL